jgi:hypothetical protein
LSTEDDDIALPSPGTDAPTDDVERLSPNSSRPSVEADAESDRVDGDHANPDPETTASEGDTAGAGDNVIRLSVPHQSAPERRPEADPDAEDDHDNESSDPADDDELEVESWDELDEAGAAVALKDFERPTRPAPEPVDGEALFGDIMATYDRFMVLPKGAAPINALWDIATWALHPCSLPFAPRLIITAPGPNCGKTTLLNTHTYLCRRPALFSTNPTEAGVRRAAKNHTIILDECDHALPKRATTADSLVGVINAGHNRVQAVVPRVEVVDKVRRVVEYPVYAMVAMGGIGNFAAPTIRSRSYVIKLRPKMVGEGGDDDFNPEDHADLFRDLRARTFRWVLDNRNAIRDCRPALNRDRYVNRARDNALMLLRIAETIGPRCAGIAREAIDALTPHDEVNANVILLGNIAELLTDPNVRVRISDRNPQGEPIGDAVFSSDLCALVRDWFEEEHGELYAGFSPAKLASMLSNFDIAPEKVGKRRPGETPQRYYRREVFDEWFARYGFVAPAAESVASVADAVVEGAAKDATPLHPHVPDQEPTEQPAAPEIVFSAALVMEAAKGDKKRGNRLRAAVDVAMRAGDAEPDAVRFICARFWVIQRDGTANYVHLTDSGELEWLPIAAPGLAIENGTVRISPEKSLPLNGSDLLVMRPAINKYRKLSVE